jgi:hypothetical protein
MANLVINNKDGGQQCSMIRRGALRTLMPKLTPLVANCFYELKANDHRVTVVQIPTIRRSTFPPDQVNPHRNPERPIMARCQ